MFVNTKFETLEQYEQYNKFIKSLLYLSTGLALHRFSTGKKISGILMILTLNGFGIWYLIDLILLMSGNFLDENRQPIIAPNGAFNSSFGRYYFISLIISITYILFILAILSLLSLLS